MGGEEETLDYTNPGAWIGKTDKVTAVVEVGPGLDAKEMVMGSLGPLSDLGVMDAGEGLG